MTRLLFLAALTLGGCGAEPLCSVKVLQVARDPISDRYATTEVRDCGATTDYATVVRVGRAGEPQAIAQEVFVADSDHGKAAYPYGGESIWTNVVWNASGVLSINYASKARVFKSEGVAKDATIMYRKTDPIDNPPVP